MIEKNTLYSQIEVEMEYLQEQIDEVVSDRQKINTQLSDLQVMLSNNDLLTTENDSKLLTIETNIEIMMSDLASYLLNKKAHLQKQTFSLSLQVPLNVPYDINKYLKLYTNPDLSETQKTKMAKELQIETQDLHLAKEYLQHFNKLFPTQQHEEGEAENPRTE